MNRNPRSKTAASSPAKMNSLLKMSYGRKVVLFVMIALIAFAITSITIEAFAKKKGRKTAAVSVAQKNAIRKSAASARRTEIARKGTEARELAGDPEGSKYEQLLEQETYWADRLTYPTGRFDPEWVRDALKEDAAIERGVPTGRVNSALLKSPNPLAMNPNSFTALGPSLEHMTGCVGCFDYGNTEGRVNAIAVDPTTTSNGSVVAYVATVGGGVWKTTNCCGAGTTWTSTTDAASVSTTSVDTVVIDPNDHNVVYVGTGDLNFGSFSMGSQGILKSTDGGATWTVKGASVFGAALPEPAGQYPQYNAVGKVRVDPNNSNNVVAGTKLGLYLSYDGGDNWTGPCLTNGFNTQRQDITGLELTNISGTTRILAAVGTRGFATPVQYNLDQNGANGLYKGTIPGSGCPSDFAAITSNANGFVYGTGVTGSPYATGNALNSTSGTPYGGNISTGNQLGRMDIVVAPSNPNYIYAQVGSIIANNNAGCANAAGCQLGVWSSIDAGATWTFLAGSQGGSLRNCGGGNTSNNPGDYPQNWYDQGMAVDPNNPDRLFVDTYDTWLVSRTGTSFYNVTCGYNGSGLAAHVVHVDHHALAFVPGSSSILLEGSDGGIFSTSNADTAVIGTTRPTWVNMDTGLNTIEFYAGDISGNFATAAAPQAVGGAQDNGPSSVTFTGSPTGPITWQMGLGGDGFSGQILTIESQASGTITTATGGSAAGQQFVVGSQTFTFVTSGTATGNVVLSAVANTQATNIQTSINRDLAGVVTATRSNAVVTVTSVAPGAGGNSIALSNINSANVTMNGTGTLGGTTVGGNPGNQFWEGNNSGGLSRCTVNCTVAGASWTSRQGGWTGDQQSFVLPINLFHGGIPGGDDCNPSGPSNGCGHLVAGTTRVFETITGATGTNSWYITNNPAGTTGGPNLTKGTLGNRSYINQVKYSPKYFSVAIVGTNDGNVQIGFNLGTGTANQAAWVNVTGANAVLPNRPILGITLDPSVPAANVPVGYAAVGGFNQNTPTTPGHVFRVSCTANCASFTWDDKTGNLPNISVDSVIVNPNFPQQVFAGSDFGLYYTDDVRVASPVWYRFNAGLPNVMIWDMQIDRGSTALSLWTRGRGAFAWPLPVGPVQPLATVTTANPASGTYGGTASVSATLTEGGFPLVGKTISFTLNGNSVGSAVTDGSGVATIPSASLAGINAGSYPTGVAASFAGDASYIASNGSATLTVNPATFTVTKTASRNPVAVELNFNYNIGVTNNGAGTASSVVMTDQLPSQVTLTASSPSQGSCSYVSATRIVTCNLSSMAPGATVTVQLTVKAREEGTLDNTANVTAPNYAPASASLNGLPAVKFVDLQVQKVGSANPIFAGQNVTYTITAKNVGTPFGATGVTLTDALPASVNFVSATTSQGSLITPPVGTNGIVTANLGSIASGATATVTITVSSTTAGVVTNSASATSTESESTPANNTGSASTTVNSSALLKVLLAKQVLTGGCENTTGNVYLTGPAGPGGVTVPLSTSSLAGVTVPASVFIPAGQSVSPAFNVTTTPVVTKQVGLVIAGSGPGSVSRGLTINVGSGSCPP
jgi:uncharacterized repeat protein (TIGR01451 family)